MDDIDPQSIKSIKDLFVATYVYECDECAAVFELTARMGDAETHPKCEKCGSYKTGRAYSLENKHFIPPANTLGALADKNSGKFSEDYKHHIGEKNVHRIGKGNQ